MNNVPADFINIYKKIIFEKNTDVQKKLCHNLIELTKDHIKTFDNEKQTDKRSPSEITGWYHELSYTWRRIYHFCETGDPVSAYLWACMLQEELMQVADEYKVPDLDILSSFDAGNLEAFVRNAEKSEFAIIRAIEADGAKLDTYVSIDEFVGKNP